MAAAYKCDRCGCYYSDNETGTHYISKDRDTRDIAGGKLYQTLDLCPTCQKMLDDWVEHVTEIQLYAKVGAGRIE